MWYTDTVMHPPAPDLTTDQALQSLLFTDRPRPLSGWTSLDKRSCDEWVGVEWNLVNRYPSFNLIGTINPVRYLLPSALTSSGKSKELIPRIRFAKTWLYFPEKIPQTNTTRKVPCRCISGRKNRQVFSGFDNPCSPCVVDGWIRTLCVCRSQGSGWSTR